MYRLRSWFCTLAGRHWRHTQWNGLAARSKSQNSKKCQILPTVGFGSVYLQATRITAKSLSVTDEFSRSSELLAIDPSTASRLISTCHSFTGICPVNANTRLIIVAIATRIHCRIADANRAIPGAGPPPPQGFIPPGCGAAWESNQRIEPPDNKQIIAVIVITPTALDDPRTPAITSAMPTYGDATHNHVEGIFNRGAVSFRAAAVPM